MSDEAGGSNVVMGQHHVSLEQLNSIVHAPPLNRVSCLQQTLWHLGASVFSASAFLFNVADSAGAAAGKDHPKPGDRSVARTSGGGGVTAAQVLPPVPAHRALRLLQEQVQDHFLGARCATSDCF